MRLSVKGRSLVIPPFRIDWKVCVYLTVVNVTVENCGKQEKEKKEKDSTSKHEHRLKANGTAEENRLGTESCDRKNTDPSNKGNGINTWADVVRKHTPQEKD